MSVLQLAQEIDASPRSIALGLMNLLRRGLVETDGSVEDAIADLKQQVETGVYR